MFQKTLWTLVFLLHEALGHEVTEQVDDTQNNATTALFPVAHRATNASTNPTNTFGKEAANKINKYTADATVWKVEAAYAESKLARKQEENVTESDDDKPQNRSQEFRPSQHLGDFFDIDSFDPSTFSRENFQQFAPVTKKPSEGFKG